MATTSSALSTYLQDGLMDRLFHATPTFTQPTAANVHLALYSTVPTADTGAGATELTYTGYARKPIDFNAASGRAVVQNGVITFGQNTGASQTAVAWGIYDAVSGGNLLAFGDINPDKAIGTNNTPSIADASITLTFTAGNVSDYLANLFLDYAFNDGTDPSTITPYAWLSTTEYTTSGNGSSLTEPADTYVRPIADTWTVTANAATNTNAINFATPGASWGVITAVGLASSVTTNAGEVLFFDNSPTGDGQEPNSGDTVAIPATTFAASVA